jgi:hypothetical protein
MKYLQELNIYYIRLFFCMVWVCVYIYIIFKKAPVVRGGNMYLLKKKNESIIIHTQIYDDCFFMLKEI